ncbi:class I SAM-dependent methyltransferase [Gelidibacter algens]|uniref:class I SAM-dependent methyltransferase n=1 Tax=Gelidibacter algens TaxID=49280 RepID=UPI0009FFDBFE|nr:class I SAM-dependent methyltransferase [Gelidibacter algens]
MLTQNLLEPFNTPTEYFFLTKRQHLETLDTEYFEALYTTKIDPWNFRDSTYEQSKYKRSIKALKGDCYRNCLELGCSIGIQTAMLSQISDQVLAIDISMTAINEAKASCSNLDNIEFKVADITKDFPAGMFDLITCCEIGYYLNPMDLSVLFKNIDEHLSPDGKLLLVHWTPFVPEYPLSGDEVHDNFAEKAKMLGGYEELSNERHDLYR